MTDCFPISIQTPCISMVTDGTHKKSFHFHSLPPFNMNKLWIYILHLSDAAIMPTDGGTGASLPCSLKNTLSCNTADKFPQIPPDLTATAQKLARVLSFSAEVLSILPSLSLPFIVQLLGYTQFE